MRRNCDVSRGRRHRDPGALECANETTIGLSLALKITNELLLPRVETSIHRNLALGGLINSNFNALKPTILRPLLNGHDRPKGNCEDED